MATETAAPSGPNLQHDDRVTVQKLKVLADFLVVRPLAVPSKMAGQRMHMPDSAGERERSHRGIVVATGPGDWNEPGTALVPMTIETGDLVFFGKYAGTEERIGVDVVLVMRESECRFCVAEGRYQLVSHDDAKLDHLIEDWCEICHGIPETEAAKEALEIERETRRLVLQSPCVCGHLGDRHAHGTASCGDCDCQGFTPRFGDDATQTPAPAVIDPRVAAIGEANEQLRYLVAARKLEGQDEHVPTILSIPDEPRRPCGNLGCNYMQRRFTTDVGEMWIGLRCGHIDPLEA